MTNTLDIRGADASQRLQFVRLDLPRPEMSTTSARGVGSLVRCLIACRIVPRRMSMPSMVLTNPPRSAVSVSLSVTNARSGTLSPDESRIAHGPGRSRGQADSEGLNSGIGRALWRRDDRGGSLRFPERHLAVVLAVDDPHAGTGLSASAAETSPP